jgi:hypothetical protein
VSTATTPSPDAETLGRTNHPTGRVRSPSASAATTHPSLPPHDPIALEPGHEIGRFTILSYLGAGSTGIVYAAYDPKLDRRVALKVLFAPDGPAVHEARAMAKLSHPNVAVVHEVGNHEGGVFIAMEFVRGATLQAWLAAEPRPWPAVLDVFLQAGRGLAAAHAAGLIHRDFKPSNVMLGDDGRVRVLDFGLCCPSEGADAEVVGTPAYMPPEQFLGQRVGPASDQFSFCASLYQALYHQLPFPGETPDELRLSITGGQLRTPARHPRLPSWLVAAILRGLKSDPKDRFSAMEDLLRALEHRSGRGFRSLAAAAVAGAALTGALGYASAYTDRSPCSAAAAEIAGAWNVQRRLAVADAFAALPRAFTSDVWPVVARALDDYADRWQHLYLRACEARRTGDSSEQLLGRRMACLGQARAALSEAATVFADADVEVAIHAFEVVHALPSLDACVTVEPDPRDAALLARLDAIDAELARVRTLDHAGRTADAVALADHVVDDAEQLADPRATASALLERARLAINSGQNLSEEEARLTRAYLLALAGAADDLAAEALALRLYVRGRTPGQVARALEDLPVAEALIARLGAPARLRGLLLNNAGTVHLAAGEPARAAALFREALMLRQALPDDLEAGFTMSNLAMLADTPDERETLLHRALAIFEAELGPAHPHTVELRIAVSAYTRDPQTALDLLTRGCTAFESFAPDRLAQRALCQFHVATHARAVGEQDIARDALARARELVAHDAGASLEPTDATLIRGWAGLLDGAHADAIAGLRQALDATSAAPGEWWPRRRRAELELCLGLNLLAEGSHTAARDVLQASVDDFTAVAGNTRDVLLPRHVADARLALAEALIAGDEPVLAASQLDAAEAWYREAGDAFAWRLAAVAALR